MGELCGRIADPGAYLPRGDNFTEPLFKWSARAVFLLVDALRAERDSLAAQLAGAEAESKRQNAELSAALSGSKSVLDWISEQDDRLNPSADGTPAHHIISGALMAIHRAQRQIGEEPAK